MIAGIIEQKKDEIAALCRKYGVRRLWAFGSVTTDRFDPKRSNLELLVDLGDYQDHLFDRYIDLASDLEGVFDHEIELISCGFPPPASYRSVWIERTSVTLYES